MADVVKSDFKDSPLKDSPLVSRVRNYAQTFKDPKSDKTKSPISRSVKLSHSISSSSSSSSASDSVSLEVWFADALPPAPDGGWGWFVVLGAFIMSIICDGCALSFGVLYVHLLDDFQASKSDTAWVGSIFYCISLLLGPLASGLTTRFGCRKVTIAAGLISCFGFVVSYFATSLWNLYITFGIIVGSGFSLCYVTSVITVAYYFDKRRSLATGLSVCGTGIGTFTFAPLCDYLVAEFGWRGTFLILGAITLNICVCGALFRPIKLTPEQRRKRALEAFNRISRTVSRLSIPTSRNRSRLHSTNSDSSSSTTGSESEEEVANLAFSEITLPTFINADEETLQMYLEKLPELRKSSVDPQVVLQRFFKSKDCKTGHKSPSTQAGEKSEQSSVNGKLEEQQQGTNINYSSEAACHSRKVSKKKRRKSEEISTNGNGVEMNKTLNKKSIEKLTEMLVEKCKEQSASDLQRPRHSKSENKLLLCRDPDMVLPDCKLERSVSTRTHHEIHKKGQNGINGHVPAANSGTGIIPARPTSSAVGDMGLLLMNKHSTYLLLHRNDIFFRGSRSASLGYATSCPELSRIPDDTESESEDEECCENCCEDHCRFLKGCRRVVLNTCDRKFLTHPLFLLFALSNFMLYFWGDVPYVFTTDFALERGMDEKQATFLISVIGIVNTFGQVFYGFVGDRGWNLTVIYGMSCIASGLSVFMLAWTNTYWQMALLSGLFGFFVSANYALMTVMLVGYLGLEKLAHAYGLLMMIQGVANLGGPPVAGLLTDETGDYEVAFLVAGGFMMLSGIILFLLYGVRLCSRLCRCCHRRSRRRPVLASGKKNANASANNNAWIGGPPNKDNAIV